MKKFFSVVHVVAGVIDGGKQKAGLWISFDVGRAAQSYTANDRFRVDAR